MARFADMFIDSDADLARRAVDPSSLSLLGLVRHMADVERGWFRRVMAGQDAPPHFSSPSDPDGDFDGAAPEPKLVAEAWEVWRDEVAFAERLVADAPELAEIGPRCHAQVVGESIGRLAHGCGDGHAG